MPVTKRTKNTPLRILEERLERLTKELSTADISEKSIDIVKEIKELSGILKSLRIPEAPEEAKNEPIVLTWEQPKLSAPNSISPT